MPDTNEYRDEIAAKPTVLIVDDNMMNRMLLSDMLGEDYEILEAEDGVEAVATIKENAERIALILLDIMMPKMNGIEVLSAMNRHGWIESIPVIVISAETDSGTVSQAFDLGATDYIDRKFDTKIVKRRVDNSIMLYARQRNLIGAIANQIYERERSNELMVQILSHIVEFRNQESGMHIRNIRIITEMLLTELNGKVEGVTIDQDYISLVGIASALHDIGKIAIPDEILNKPGRFNDEEYAIMQTHTTEGAKMLEKIPMLQDEPLVKTAYEIARWHHERFDGGGYPDKLKGNDIPISAQVVSIADVYDALTAKRIYKDAFTHEKALEMIHNGECGQFNPDVLHALDAIAVDLQEAMNSEDDYAGLSSIEMGRIADEISATSELSPLNRTIQQLELEKMKYQFFASLSDEIHFEYTSDPSTLILHENGARFLNLPEVIYEPVNDEGVLRLFEDRQILEDIGHQINLITPEFPKVDVEMQILIDGSPRWIHLVMRGAFSKDGDEIQNVFGKITDIHENRIRMEQLMRAADTDTLTGLHRADGFRDLAESVLEENDHPYAMIMIDVDNFKEVNDSFGHDFGNTFLKEIAKRLHDSLRNDDLIARVGGDEFLVLAQFDRDNRVVLNRLQENLIVADDHGFSTTASIGVSFTEDIGRDYSDLFNAADKALYSAKKSGKNQYMVYSDDMKDVLAEPPTIIESEAELSEGQKTD